jgi:hypothetical protein
MTDHEAKADAAAKQRDEAEKKRGEEAKKKIAEESKAREAANKERATKGGVEASKPTPTQEENDLAASGVHVMEKEPDGSDEQPSPEAQMDRKEHKQSEAKPAPKAGGYQTRTAGPQ